MQDFTQAKADRAAEHYAADLDNTMLCMALSGAGEAETETRKALYSRWLFGSFNAAAYGLKGIGTGYGVLDWQPDRDSWTPPNTGLVEVFGGERPRFWHLGDLKRGSLSARLVAWCAWS